MNIQYLNPKALTPYGNNAKVHTKEQIKELAKTIKTFGFDQPIVVDQHHVIIKGHGRQLAALQLKLPLVPVIVAEHLTPEQVKLSRIIDNDVVGQEWDADMLKDDLQDLLSMGGSLDMACSSEDEFNLLLASSVPSPVEVSDTLMPALKTKHTCPQCEYRW